MKINTLILFANLFAGTQSLASDNITDSIVAKEGDRFFLISTQESISELAYRTTFLMDGVAVEKYLVQRADTKTRITCLKNGGAFTKLGFYRMNGFTSITSTSLCKGRALTEERK